MLRLSDPFIPSLAPNFKYNHPEYAYDCMGFQFRYDFYRHWFIMDDYGNAVVSVVNYEV
jgi:hypothetical protein